jgi:glyoxylate reductase
LAKRVYVTHPLPEAILADLAAQCDLRVGEAGAALRADAIPTELHQCSGLICLLTDQVDAALVEALPSLEFVSSISVGVDHIDVNALNARGIPLGHTPGVLVDATADTAFALMLSAARRVAEGDRFVRAGQWLPDQPWSPDFFLGKDVSGATLGIVGLGAIGQAVARRAAGFGMRVVSWNRNERDVPGVENVSLDELLLLSDFVSVHVALNEDTRDLINAERIKLMKPGAVLINTARGGIVNEEALVEALDSGHLYAAGLDVYEREPLPLNSPLLQHPRVVLVPHIGSATTRTRGAMVDLAVKNALAAALGQPMPHCFNPEVYP